MSIQMLPNEDHEVLGSEVCSGYVDSYGKWNAGFFCPSEEVSQSAVYCCGTSTYKYCCTSRDEPFAFLSEYIASLTLMLGVACGAALVIVIIVVLSCFFCSCCYVYKRRRNNGPLYQMHSASSAASGVANMYSFSNQNSSATTPVDPANPHKLVDLGYDTIPDGSQDSRSFRDGRGGSKGHQNAPPPYYAQQSFVVESHKKPHGHHHHHHHHHHHNHSHHRHHRRHQSDDVLMEESPDADATPNKDVNVISVQEAEDENKVPPTSPNQMNGVPPMGCEKLSESPREVTSPSNDETLYWSTKF